MRTIKYYHPVVYQRLLGPMLVIDEYHKSLSTFSAQGFADIDMDKEFNGFNLMDIFVDVCWQQNVPAIVALAWPDFLELYELRLFTPPMESWFSYAVKAGNIPPYPGLFREPGHETCNWRHGGVTRFNTREELRIAAVTAVSAYENAGIRVRCENVEIQTESVTTED